MKRNMAERRENTNARYKHFNQELFTAGDYEQFVSFLSIHRKPMGQFCPDNDNGEKSVPSSPRHRVLFDHHRWTWPKYKCGPDLFGTFEYIFHKFKKGIYVQIKDNALHIFLPFSNVEYNNEYQDSLFVDKNTYSSFEAMYEHICLVEGRKYVSNRVCRYPSLWYCNNGLVRYEFPLKENDSGINMIHDMLQTLCRERTIPDCEFFVNKRDFPILSLNDHEPYTALVPSKTPLYSYALENYLPVLGMTTRDDCADLPIPTWEDWCRCAFQHDGRTFGKHFKEYPDDFHQDFDSKKATVIFRGASTGLGTSLTDNPRLFFSKLSSHGKCKEDGETPFLDVGITKWNARPRKNRPSDPLRIPDPCELGISLVESMCPKEQSNYKYILHLPGHSFAYRLSLELSMGSVILLYPCDYTIWYMPLLKPYVHYIPLEKGMDMEEIFTVVRWCDAHPQECATIAKNSRLFYKETLSYDATLDYLQDVFQQMSFKFQFHETSYVNMNDAFMEVRHGLLSKPPEQDVPSLDISDTNMTILHKTKRTTIYSDASYTYKLTEKDMTHSHFVSQVLQQEVGHLCPCFSSSRGVSNNGKVLISSHRQMPVGDYVFAMSLEKYLQSPLFKMHQLKLVLNQILWSIKIAQAKVGFVHYDLSPWNVLLYETRKRGGPSDNKLVFEYFDKTISVHASKYVAKMIDYEYSSVVYQDHVVHNMQPFFLSYSHDMVTLLYNSFHILLKHQKLSRDDMKWIGEILQRSSGVDFHSVQHVKYFLSLERKFSKRILDAEKHALHGRDVTFLQELEQLLWTSGVYSKNRYNDWCSSPLEIEPDMATLSGWVRGSTMDIETLYTFQKTYEHFEKKLEQCFDMSARKDVMDEMSLIQQDCREQKWKEEKRHVRSNSTTVVVSTSCPNRRHLWSHIRWLSFAGVRSLHLPPSLSIARLQKILYLSNFGFIDDSHDKAYDEGVIQEEFSHRLLHIWNRLIS